MLIFVHLVIAAHIAHWLVAGRTITPVEPSEAMAFAKGGMINAGLIFFAATILLTAIFGRFFCGWACHLVALQDLARWLLEKVGIRPKPLTSRWLRVVPLLAFAYMFLWPVVYRIHIGDSFSHVGTELTTTEFWATFPGWVVGGLTFLICGFVIIYFLGAKGFCTYACPYGAIYGVAEKVSPMRIRVTDACAGCAHCTAVCTSNVRVHEEVRDYGMVVDSGCMKCLDCVSVCPNDALYYGAGPIGVLARPRVEKPAPRRRGLPFADEAVLAVAFLTAFLAFRGLYGAVPFLLALGWAGVLAFLVLLAVRLWRQPSVAKRPFVLKREGRLTRGGWAFVSAGALLAALWVHSAFVRYHAYLGDRAFAATARPRVAALDISTDGLVVEAAEKRALESGIRHLETVRDAGLMPTAGNAARLAGLYLATGKPGLAVTEAQRSIQRGEFVAGMQQIVGRAAVHRGELWAAVAAYEAALADEPDSERLYLDLGTILGRSGNLPMARDVFSRALARFEGSVDLFYNAGIVAALEGNADEAISLLERGLALDPTHRPARENLAGLFASQGRFEESVELFQQAVFAAPDDLDTRFLLARALVGAGDLERAENELNEVLRRAPGHPRAANLLREIAANQNATSVSPDGSEPATGS